MQQEFLTNHSKRVQSGERVKLNIGGTIFVTLASTLTGFEEQSMLAAMFSGRHHVEKDEDGSFYFDRDPDAFATAPSRLVAYWQMNEGSGSHILDVSGNAFHATVKGDIKWIEDKAEGRKDD